MKKILALLLCVAVVGSLAACGGNKGGKNAKDELSVCLASEPQTLDPALNSAVDGGTLAAHVFSGLAKWAKNSDGKLILVADCAKELPEGVVNADGKVTYTYTLKDGLKWSDGKPVTAADFVFAWNRAASPKLGANYGYMFELVDGYDEVTAIDDKGNPTNPDAKLNVKAVDEKTIEVTLKNAINYWNELLAFPIYFPVREDVVSNESWATDPSTYIGNGPYVMSAWEHNSVITLTKNDKYVDADKITMKKINFYLSDDANNMLTNFESGDWQLIDDVPTDEISNLKDSYKDEFFVKGQIGTYYVCWNINEEILPKDSKLSGAEADKAKAEIRKALSLVIDRNYIVEKITQAGQVPAPSFVAMGMTNPDGSEFCQSAGNSKDFDGYYNVAKDAFEKNFASAVETLKKYYKYDEASKKFTNVPVLTYLYNTGDSHKAIGEYLQSAFAAVGITMNLENQEWNTFLETRKQGGYSVARNGWLADYNDPISFLDMWTTASGNNDVQLGKGAHEKVAIYNLDLTPFGYKTKVVNGTWAQTYDELISTIKSCTDKETRYKLMHLAEDMLMDTGCIVPLYFYTDIYMLNKNVEGFYSNPLGFKYFMYCTIK